MSGATVTEVEIPNATIGNTRNRSMEFDPYGNSYFIVGGISDVYIFDISDDSLTNNFDIGSSARHFAMPSIY